MGAHRAKKLFEAFREKTARRARSITFRIPTAVAVIGTVDAISYRTTHGSHSYRYKHSFAPGSRPLLCSDGTIILLVGGRYKVTERGIIDLTARGRERE